MFGSTAFALAAMLAGCTTAAGEPEQTSAPTPTSAVDYQQQANDNWWDLWMVDYPDAVKPEVEVVREIAPSERGQATKGCMEAAGYPTTLELDGTVGYDLPPDGQKEAHAIAVYTCFAQYPLAEKYLRPATPEQLGRLYDYWTGEATDCLAAHGFPPSEEPPSRETYIQEQESISWTPFNGLWDAVGAEEEEYYAISAECVRYPDDIY